MRRSSKLVVGLFGLVWTVALFALATFGQPTQPYLVYGFVWLLGLASLGYWARWLVHEAARAARTAAEMHESQRRYRALFDDAPIAYHEIDRDGTVHRVNATECRLLGYKPSDIIGYPVWKNVPEEVQPISRENVRRKIAGEQSLRPFCREYVRRDGRRLIFEVHENHIFDSEGNVIGIRSALLDVTERERALRDLARSNAELEQFAYVASHDLQEPLRKIMAFSDRLRSRFADAMGETGRDYMDRMCNAAARMQILINDLLMLSRVKRKGQPFTQVDLNKVLKNVQADLEVRIEQTHARVECEPLPTITADLLQMSQLFQNLIGNSLKFRKPELPPVVHVRGEVLQEGEESHSCRITVEDNGIGFEEKYADRIFQVFQRLHGRNEYEGTGIGLAVCRQIAERHGGVITAESSLGAGARFIVTLPVEQEKKGVEE